MVQFTPLSARLRSFLLRRESICAIDRTLCDDANDLAPAQRTTSIQDGTAQLGACDVGIGGYLSLGLRFACHGGLILARQLKLRTDAMNDSARNGNERMISLGSVAA